MLLNRQFFYHNHNILLAYTSQNHTLNLITFTKKTSFDFPPSTDTVIAHLRTIKFHRKSHYRSPLSSANPRKNNPSFFQLKQLHIRVFRRANNNSPLFFVALKLNYGRPENVYERVCVGE